MHTEFIDIWIVIDEVTFNQITVCECERESEREKGKGGLQQGGGGGVYADNLGEGVGW